MYKQELISMKTKKTYSITRRLTVGLFIIFVLLLAILLLNNFYTSHIFRRNITNQLSDALSAGNKQISSDLNNISTYLSTLSINTPDINIIEQNKKDTSFYSSIYNLKQTLSSGLRAMPIADGLFIFSAESDQFINTYRNQNYYLVNGSLKNWCRQTHSAGTLDSYVSKYWFPYECDDNYYIVKLLKSNSTYVGCWIKISNLLSVIDTPESLNSVLYFTFDESLTCDTNSLPVDYVLHPSIQPVTTQYIRIKNIKYLAVHTPALYTDDGYLYMLAGYNNITRNMKQPYLLLLFSFGAFLVLVIATYLLFRTYLSKPIRQLEISLLALRNGDFSIRLPEGNGSIEFNDVNIAFNQMVQRIEKLKIDIYEEKINQQKTELLALKNQIAPHFLINCLNSIYHMAVSGNTDNIQHMTVYLGEHLRYALSDVTYVPLSVELEKVRNYVELSKIRFPDSICLFLELPETMQDAIVPPMILLFQVENIIKYEVVYGEITEIHIEIQNESTELVHLKYSDFVPLKPTPARYLHFTIWDTGTGYSTQVLKQLQIPQNMNQSDGHNIGTKNTFKRLNLLFSGNFYMNFSNRLNAGAQLDILIPYKKTDKEERRMI